jgi:hypothetical protein
LRTIPPMRGIAVVNAEVVARRHFVFLGNGSQ